MLDQRAIYKSRRWARLRGSKLNRDPLCEACNALGRVTPAVAVDHIRAMSAGGEPYPKLRGLMSLCTSCHSIKTGREKGNTANVTGRRLPGIDASGSPICPQDTWNNTQDGNSPTNSDTYTPNGDQKGGEHHENSKARGPTPTLNGEFFLNENSSKITVV